MSPTLTATATIQAESQSVAIAYLMKIEFTSPAAYTLYVCDGAIADLNFVAIGQEWLPLVTSWGSIDEAMNRMDAGGRPGTLTGLTFDNTLPVATRSRISGLVRTPANTVGSYEWLFAKVTIYQWFRGLATGNEVRQGIFYIDEILDVNARTMGISMSDLTSYIETRPTLLRIDRTTFRDASPTVLGKRIPAIFGALSGVPLLPIQAGGYSRLTIPLPATGATTFTVDDGDPFPSSGLFNVQIEGEVIKCNGRTGDVLNIAGRAQAGTVAVLHDVDRGCYELRARYLWAICENLSSGLFQTKNAFTFRSAAHNLTGMVLSLNNTDLVAGRSFVTVDLPGFTKLPINPEPPPPVPQIQTVTRSMSNRPIATLTWLPGSHGGSAFTKISMPTLDVVGAIVQKVRYTMDYYVQITGSIATGTHGSGWRIARDSITIEGTPQSLYGGPRNGVAWTDNAYRTSIVIGIDNASALVDAALAVGGVFTVQITKCEAVVEYTQRTAPGAAPRVVEPLGESTADIVWGAMSCDVTGLQDDASGIISGTPLQVLTNPSDVTQLILRKVYPNTTAATIGASFATSRASLAAASIAWAAYIDAEIPFSQLRRKLGEQARCTLMLDDGLWEYIFLTTGPVAVHTLDSTYELVKGSVRLSKTSKTQVKNSLHVFAAPDFRKGTSGRDRFRYSEVIEDLAYPITGITNDQLQEDMELDFIKSHTVARALGQFWLAWKKRSRAEVGFTGLWSTLAINKLDAFAIDNDDEIDEWGGTALVFRILERRYLNGDKQIGSIAYVGVEANA